MLIHHVFEFAKPSGGFLHWVRHLGGPGLIVLGLIDNSVIPIPGSMDAVTILLAAKQRTLWPYYALMATIGSVLGGFVTYRLAGRQGKGAMERRLSRKHMKQVTKAFEKWGFGAVLIPAILPPPAPMVPFLLAAGAMQFSRNKFLLALTIGRGIRFTILAYLGQLYGRQIITLIANNAKPILITFIAAAVAISLYVLYRYKHKRSKSRQTA